MKVPAVFVLAVLTLLLGSALGYRIGLNRNPESSVATATDREKTDEASASNDQESISRGPIEEAERAELVERRGFEDRAKAALAFESNRKKAYEIERLFEDLNTEDAPALLARMLEWPDSRERRGMLRPFFVKWGELDGPVALEAAESLLGRDKTDALSAAYAGWAKSDPHAAWEKAETFLAEESPFSAYTVRGAMAELAKADMDAALRIVSTEKHDIKRQSLSSSMLEGIFEADRVAELVGKIGSLEDLDTKKSLLSAVFTRWGENDSTDPMEAMSQIKDPELAKGAMSGFLKGWANEDREGAIRYALDNRENPLIADSFGEMLRMAIFRGSNSENQQLLTDVTSAGMLDKLASELVGGASFANPQFALEVAESVTNSEDRTAYQQMALGGLARTDLESAISYFGEKIPVEEKSKILPSISWQISQSPEGGAHLLDLYQQVPEGRDRSKMVEALLNGAVSPYAKASEDYLTSLEAIATSESGLSEEAVKNREKLFGSEN